MPECPADGCEYSGVVQSVAAHYSGKRDDAHSGGYHDAKAQIDSSAGSQTETSIDPDPEPDGGSDDLDFPENPDASDPDPEPEPSRSRCSECGSSNYASADLALQKIPNLSDRAKRALKAHEYHCHDCGEVFDL